MSRSKSLTCGRWYRWTWARCSDSVRKTTRLVVAHESVGFCGPGAEIAAAVGTELFGVLSAPIQRVAGTYTPVPRAATLEAACQPRRQLNWSRPSGGSCDRGADAQAR